MKYKRQADSVIFPWLESNLELGKTIVDIGARKGHWYKNLTKTFGNNTAYLFEPTPNIADWLKRKYTNVNVEQCALSNENGKLEFHIDLEKGGWSGLKKQRSEGKYETIFVDVKTLDDYNLSNVGLIKIDVEGAELRTLQGAKNTIVKNKPIIYFECADVHLENYEYDANDIFDFFESINYDIIDLDFNKCTKEKLAEHTASKSSFYHNFIACPQ